MTCFQDRSFQTRSIPCLRPPVSQQEPPIPMLLKAVFKRCMNFTLVMHAKSVRFHLPSYVAKRCHARFWQLSLTNNKSFPLKQKCAVPPSNIRIQLLHIPRALDNAATGNQGSAPPNPRPGERGEVCHQFKLNSTQNLAPRK